MQSIVAPIVAGGMREVYRAKDTHLDRDVDGTWFIATEPAADSAPIPTLTVLVNWPGLVKRRSSAAMNPELRRIAARVVWWDTPEPVLSHPDDSICRVMALGDLHDARRRLWDGLRIECIPEDQ